MHVVGCFIRSVLCCVWELLLQVFYIHLMTDFDKSRNMSQHTVK